MADATIHEDNDTPMASGADIKRYDKDTNFGHAESSEPGESKAQAIDATNAAKIETAPKT